MTINEKQPNLSFKKTMPFILAIITFLVAFFTTQYLLKPKEDALIEELTKVATELNNSLPHMVDEETRIDSTVALTNNVFQYNYTLVNVIKATFPVDLNELKSELQKPIVNNAKTNPKLAFFREKQTTMEYIYNDKNGAFLFKIEVLPEMYVD